jgi:hypothetical protein
LLYYWVDILGMEPVKGVTPPLPGKNSPDSPQKPSQSPTGSGASSSASPQSNHSPSRPPVFRSPAPPPKPPNQGKPAFNLSAKPTPLPAANITGQKPAAPSTVRAVREVGPGRPASPLQRTPSAPVVIKPLTVPSANAKTAPEAVVIRTMQDDLVQFAQQKSLAAAAVPTSSPPGPVPSKSSVPVAISAPTQDSDNQTFPLPPRSAKTKPEKVVTEPLVKVERHMVRRVVLILVCLSLIVGGLGAAGWFLLFNNASFKSLISPNEQVADIHDLLPKQTLFYLGYTLTPDSRPQIRSIWEKSTVEQPSFSRLLTGDPRLLLDDTAITHLYYVVLEDDSHPYVVIPKTTQTKDMVSQSSSDQVLERSGWYILHPSQVGNYSLALQAGILDKTISSANSASSDTPSALEMVLTPSFVTQLRSRVANPDLNVGQLTDATLVGQISHSNESITFQGSGHWQAGGSQSDLTDDHLLPIIPQDARFVRLGGNFAADIAAWQSIIPAIHSETLSRPEVKNLLSLLTGAYSFYLRSAGSGGEDDLQLIIELPASLRGKLNPGDPAIEAALPALYPLIFHREQKIPPIAFASASYGSTAIRYVNLTGSAKALDYAVTKDYLLIATSKEGMFTLLDTLAGQKPNITTNTQIAALFSEWGAIPKSQSITIGYLTQPVLGQILPDNTPDTPSVPLALTVQQSEAGTYLQGIIQLIKPTTAVVVPLASPLPSPTP